MVDGAIVRLRQYRGLVIHWNRRPPSVRPYRPRDEAAPAFDPGAAPRFGQPGSWARHSAPRAVYSRHMCHLPTMGTLRGKDATAHRGRCRWCERPIEERGRTLWHSYCLPAYWAATGDLASIQAWYWRAQKERGQEWLYLGIEDDYYSRPCAQCGSVVMRELDHRDALSVAWASGSERRMMRALSLTNLRWLCHDCHSTKTGLDRKKMNNLLSGLPEDHGLEPTENRMGTLVPVEQMHLL